MHLASPDSSQTQLVWHVRHAHLIAIHATQVEPVFLVILQLTKGLSIQLHQDVILSQVTFRVWSVSVQPALQYVHHVRLFSLVAHVLKATF